MTEQKEFFDTNYAMPYVYWRVASRPLPKMGRLDIITVPSVYRVHNYSCKFDPIKLYIRGTKESENLLSNWLNIFLCKKENTCQGLSCGSTTRRGLWDWRRPMPLITICEDCLAKLILTLDMTPYKIVWQVESKNSSWRHHAPKRRYMAKFNIPLTTDKGVLKFPSNYKIKSW